ncbi:hypothetical protein FB639_005939 [Coemansia asiatica]|nr:hypothetical protein FB639_005939 [Coemansia asiatica]
MDNESSGAEKDREGQDVAEDSGSESSGSNSAEGKTGAATSASDPQDRFLLTIRRFVLEATEQYDSLTSQFAAMEEAYTNTVLLYGEDPQTMAPEEFFGIFKTFTASFNQVIRDNNRERERKRAAEKRRKQIEQQIEQKRMAKQNRANRLATGASRVRDQLNSPSSQEPSTIDDDLADASAVSGAPVGGENGAVDDLLKSLMAGTDLERVEATKRRRRRELMSIRRRSSVRRSVHRTSISIKALQMLRDIKEDEEGGHFEDEEDYQQQAVPPLPSASARRSILRRQQHNNVSAEWMEHISEDEDHAASNELQSMASRRAARRRQLLDD